jgi:hypothetical protein
MASAKDVLIQQLHQVENLLAAIKKEENLTKEDWKIYSIAERYFGKKYFFKNNYSKFLHNLPVSAVSDYIAGLEDKGEEKESKQKKPKEQEASIPPELEAMVAEYRQNQALLESEEVKSSSQKSVAEQVKIAIAHSKIKDLALANRERRLSQGEKLRNQDEALVSLGSPKSGSKTAALAASYKAVQEVAFTHENFTKLSPEVQNRIITEAAELNTICVTNIDVAIQSASLLIKTEDISPDDQKNVTNISSNYIRSVYDAVNTQTKQAAIYETQIAENEVVLLQLENEAQFLTGKALEIKQIQIKSLTENNQQLATKINNLPGQFYVFVNNQSTDYKKFETDSQDRLSKDPDLIDKIELANKSVATLQNNLENNGVKPHIYSPMDEAHLLEMAIRHDMPGVLRQSAGYEAEESAALISHPNTQNSNLSPQSILLYGKELTPTLLAKARLFAQNNPDSALGILLKTRRDLFDSAGTQLKKISQSPLGKEILKPLTGIGKILKPISGYFRKVSDKIGAFSKVLGTVAGVVQNPWGALRSWAGRKAGQYILRQIAKNLTNQTLKEGSEMLLKNGLKGTIKKLIAKAAAEAAAKAAIKLGIKTGTKLTLEAAAQAANVIPGLGIVIAVVIDVLWWIGEKTIGVIRSVSRSLWGEDVKARDLLVVPVTGAATFVGGIVTFFGTLASATAAAASSAVGIVTAGIFIGFFFYITSIVVAPLISTLVQLETSPHTGKAIGCANIEGTFVSQRDPVWSNTFCPNCTSADKCNIGGSGCGSASTTMVLKSFGVDVSVVDIWDTMHNNGAYVYKPNAATHPYTSCPSSSTGNLQILTEAGLAITSIGTSLDEADKVLSSCGLIFTLGQLYTDCPDQVVGCGHYLVITGHDGNLITTNDPWSGENYVHNIDGIGGDTFTISNMWAVVP